MSIVSSVQLVLDRLDLPKDKKVSVAVSGGADSTALLRILHMIGMDCTLVHLNHKLRGQESDEDEKFVKNLAEELSIPFITKSENVHAYAKRKKISLEMAGRETRHLFFNSLPIKTITLAHHADDQAENFFIKISRGTGPDGLSGMSISQRIGSIRLIRPLLHISHDEICNWLKANNYNWREDATNRDMSILRNRVRHIIIPTIRKELNPDITSTLNRTMKIIRQENEWIEKEASCLSIDNINQAPLVLRRRWIRDWLHNHNIFNISFDITDKIANALDKNNGTRSFDINHQWKAVIEYGKPSLINKYIKIDQPFWNLQIKTGKGWKIDHGHGPGILPAEASLSAEKTMNTTLKARAIRPGDRFKPLGMKGHRKLQDILTDQKIPVSNRSKIPVVTCGKEIVWVPGFRIASGWEVTGKESDSIHLQISNIKT